MKQLKKLLFLPLLCSSSFLFARAEVKTTVADMPPKIEKVAEKTPAKEALKSSAVKGQKGVISKKEKPKTTAPEAKLAAVQKETEKQCRFTIFGNDRMLFVDEKDKKVNEIKVPYECKTFVLNFAYKGQLSSSIMGHNIVITEEKHKEAVVADALKQGKKSNYLPGGKVAEDFVIAASKHTLGGGKGDFHKEDISVDMSKVDPEKSYTFFCAFRGHAIMMKGSFVREKPKATTVKPSTQKAPIPEAPKSKSSTTTGTKAN